MLYSNRCRYLTHTPPPLHTNKQKHLLNTCNPPASSSLSPCPMWAVASAARPSDCCHGVKHPCNPQREFNHPPLRLQSTLLPGASCFPRVLSTERGYERRKRAEKQTHAAGQASSFFDGLLPRHESPSNHAWHPLREDGVLYNHLTEDPCVGDISNVAC